MVLVESTQNAVGVLVSTDNLHHVAQTMASLSAKLEFPIGGMHEAVLAGIHGDSSSTPSQEGRGLSIAFSNDHECPNSPAGGLGSGAICVNPKTIEVALKNAVRGTRGVFLGLLNKAP